MTITFRGPNGSVGGIVNTSTVPGSLGNRISPPSYATTSGVIGGGMAPPPPSQSQYVLPPTPTGTTVDRWGISWPPAGSSGTLALPGTGNVFLDTSAFSFGGINFTWSLVLLLVAILVIALVFLL